MNISFAAELHEAHETPNKRIKDKEPIQFKTAESEQAPSLSLDQVDAKDLFEKFEEIVKISQEDFNDSEQFQEDVYRKLDYDSVPNIKLDFEFNSSSMKKKRPNFQIPEKEKFQGINLFSVSMKEEKISPENEQKSWNFDSPKREQRQSGLTFSGAPAKERRE